MSIFELNDIFLDTEIEDLKQIIDVAKKTNTEDSSSLGRMFILKLDIPEDIKEKITKICSNLLGIDLNFTHAAYAEYSNLYGHPNLPPHFDADENILVVDYQLEANTSWDLGINLKSYPLKDNSALIFNANEHMHWRPHKTFKDNEYVKMIFFRCYDPKNYVDNSHLNYLQESDIFKEARKFRDSIQ
jgi:hypothetical protein